MHPPSSPVSEPVSPAAGFDRRGWAIASLAAALALATAALTRGRTHADEVFQFLEPAHHVAFGDWVPMWEWSEGLRNWAVPGLLGLLLRAAAAVGLDHPWALTGVIWCVVASAQGLATMGLIRLVRERDGEPAATLAGLAHATWGGFLVFSARTLGDSLCVVFLVPALLYAQRALRAGRSRDGWMAGLCFGACFVVRYPSAVFGFPIFAVLALARRPRPLLTFTAGAAAVLVLLGALDAATWGRPFHSVLVYFGYNLLRHGEQAARFGSAPWWWYFETFAGMTPILLGWHFLRGLGRRDLLVAEFAVYFAAISLHGHKEGRFALPLLPLFIAIAAGPAARLLAQPAPWAIARRWAFAALFAVNSIASPTILQPTGFHAGIIDAAVVAGRDPGFRGLIVDGPPVWHTGGRYYLHRRGPLFTTYQAGAEVQRALQDRGYSHLISEKGVLSPEDLARAGFTPVRTFGSVVLYRR